MDVYGTEQADLYQPTDENPSNWTTYHALGGNDTIRMHFGTALGGSGNDTIEQLPVTQWWQRLTAAYWNSPAGVVVDLAAGTAQDGWGGVDTLVGIDHVHGNGHADQLRGNGADNFLAGNGGNDLIDGRGGIDTALIGWVGSGPLTLDTAIIDVSIDGRSATVRSTTSPNFVTTLVDVERLALDWNSPVLALVDFIDPARMATQGLVGSDSQRWNAGTALATAVTVSFSFVESAAVDGFRAFTGAERATVRAILASVAAVTQLTFAEVAETGGQNGQLRFGVSQQAASKGQAQMPGSSAAAGDVWMDVESMLALVAGTEGYQALLHEIGHALGLRHPRNVDPGDAWTAQWRAADDITTMSVMASGASADGMFRADWSALDVAALRHLYGTRSINVGNDVYVVGGSDAMAQRSLVDDGGVDTMDASASAVGVRLDMAPAHRSSVGVSSEGLLGVDNLILGVNSWIENAIGSASDDVLIGNALGNRLTGGLGNDWIDGGAGLDFAAFSGNHTDYTITNAFGYHYVTANDGTSGFDTLVNVERIRFGDFFVAIDVEGNGGKAYRLYQAAFNRTPDIEGLGYQINDLDRGVSLQQVSSNFIASPEFNTTYGALTDSQFVRQLYLNVLHREPEPMGLLYHVDRIIGGAPRSDILIGFSESPENKAALIGTIENGMVYTPMVFF